MNEEVSGGRSNAYGKTLKSVAHGQMRTIILFAANGQFREFDIFRCPFALKCLLIRKTPLPSDNGGLFFQLQ